MRGSPNLYRGGVLAFAVVLAYAPSVGNAQQIRGVVRDLAAGTPLAGTVVSVLDSGGTAAARTIADAQGRFTLPRRPSARGLRAIRIGYEPRELPIPSAPGDVALDVAMTRIPPLLDAVKVAGRELCPGSTDRGAAFQVWEQAGAGLLGQVVANDAGAVTAHALTFRRRVSPSDGLVSQQVVETHRGPAIRAFAAAATPATFADRGYMEEDASGRTFHAPDADVLLHETFAATHCFHLQAADFDHVGQVGLAFAPAPGRDTLVDVSGVLWIDDAMHELRSFDFRYTGLERAAMRAEVGGHMDFRVVPNGVSFIERWTLRLPILEALVASANAPRRVTRRRDRADLRVAAIEETGGQVLDATWNDGTAWTAPPTGIAGVVSETKTDVRLPGATVSIDGTAARATTDERGAFTLVPVVPGRYAVSTTDSSLSALAPPRRARAIVDVAPGQIADLHPVLASVARERAMASARPRAIRGVVTDTASRPLANVAVAVVGGDSTRTDAAGRFRVSLPPSGSVALDIRRIGFTPTLYSLGDAMDTSIAVTLLPLAQQLATVKVSEREVGGLNMRGFDERMRARSHGAGGGYFITAADIERQSPDHVTSILANVPEIRVLRVGLNNYSVFGRARNLRDGPNCAATIFLDGIRLQEGGDVLGKGPDNQLIVERGVAIDGLITPGNIAGIEVYASGNAAPPAYSALNGSCSVVLIWTKSGR